MGLEEGGKQEQGLAASLLSPVIQLWTQIYTDTSTNKTKALFLTRPALSFTTLIFFNW